MDRSVRASHGRESLCVGGDEISSKMTRPPEDMTAYRASRCLLWSAGSNSCVGEHGVRGQRCRFVTRSEASAQKREIPGRTNRCP